MYNGIALDKLDKVGNYLGTGHGIVLVLLGRHIFYRNPWDLGRGTSPGSVVHRAKKDKAVTYLNVTKRISDVENVHHRHNLRRDTGVTPSVTLSLIHI